LTPLIENLSAGKAFAIGTVFSAPTAFFAATTAEGWIPATGGAATGVLLFLCGVYKLGADKALTRTEERLGRAEDEIDRRIQVEAALKVQVADLQARLDAYNKST